MIRHLFSQTAAFPIQDTVFDYFLNEKYEFCSWKDKVPSINLTPGCNLSQILIPTTVTTAYMHVLDVLSSINQSVLLVGKSGVGKSAILNMHVDGLLKQKEVELVKNSFSARSTSAKTQFFIEKYLERGAGGFYSGVSNKKLLIFIDDISMPSKDLFGTQPAIELLRQLLDSQGFYERKKHFFKKILNFTLLSACGITGISQISPRFLRHLHIFYVSEPTHSLLSDIFSPILLSHIDKSFPEQIRKAIPGIISSTIDLYEKIVEKLKPTPLKFHYQFNIRDIGKTIQGFILANSGTLPTLDKLAKLWLNECCRVFADRLVNQVDRVWFNKAASLSGMKYFKSGFLNEDWLETHPLLFSNLLTLHSAKPCYEEILDKKRVKRLVEGRLDDYNNKGVARMHLEIFDEALEHIVRICRIVYQKRGHVMAIGVGGSGKQSLAKLSSFLLSFEIFQLKISKNYNIENFHEDLKKMMRVAGLENKPISFVFSDQELLFDSFLEDLNSLINSGEVSDLFTDEELENLLVALRPDIVERQGGDDTKENIYARFVDRVRDNLHLIMCTSPAGDLLRKRCKMFPGLINCSTLDWFENWPEQALLSVANSRLSIMGLGKKGLMELMSSMHLSAEKMTCKYSQELRRVSYVTPKLFFDFFEIFAAVLGKTNSFHSEVKKKLTAGLAKLHETREIIGELRVQLQKMIPDLEIQKKKAENYYIEVQKETVAAVDLQQIVEKETEFIEIQAEECRFRAVDAEKDLADTMPILESAMKAVQALEKNKKDIIEFKKYLNPPEAVKMVMEAVCILLNERTDWSNAISVLGQMDFLQKLLMYNRESISTSIFKKLKNIVSKPEFTPDAVAQSSEAARSLCLWCIAMYKFTEAFNLVKPKREKVFAMQAKLKTDMEKLEKKQKELEEVENKVKVLKDQCEITEMQVASLEKNINVTGERVQRAELLLELLAEEGVKWEDTLVSIDFSLKYLENESILNAGAICYLGVYSDEYRNSLKSDWRKRCEILGLDISNNYSIVSSIGQPIEIRSWQIAGLPKDCTSIENSLLAVNSLKWPLMVDPQDQARRWIKNMEKPNNLLTIKPNRFPTNRDLLHTLEIGITQGKPVLLEDLGERFDPSISQILSKKIYKKEDGRTVIKLADQEIPYDEKFKLFLLTKIANPHFLPNVFGDLNVINFTVTPAGLEDQLLSEVVKLENSQLERQRDKVIVSLANDQKLLQEAQTAILDMIVQSQGYILDNIALISALQKSKNASRDIIKRVADTAAVQERLNAARNLFALISVRGAILYFVVSEIPGINPMYQYSLAFFTKIFNSSIQNTEGKEGRVEKIIENITKNVFLVVSRGLFEKDKKVLAFLFASAIEKHSGVISSEAWAYFIRGPGLVSKKLLKKNPLSSKLSEEQWDFLCKLENNLKSFEGLTEDMVLFKSEWELYINSDILTVPAPHQFILLSGFFKVLLIKVLRPEKLIYAIKNYTAATLGHFFAENPQSTLETLFEESDKKTPIFFILSQGTDPIENILKVSREKSMQDKLQIISIGQGQGTKAQEAIEKGKTNGGWVLLQNCHLSKSWLPALEIIIENLQDDLQAHRDFRVILTAMPSSFFPVSILQNSLKVTTEPPAGIKANMISLYGNIDITESHSETFRKMVFAISFFHALVMERRKFGPLGFNIKYEFNDSDFYTSVKLTKLLLEENEEVPWEGIQFIVGNINYGGRVADLNDRLCLLATFNKCCNPDVLEENYCYTDDGVYKVPLQIDCLDYLKNLPSSDSPKVFGLNENAQISLEAFESSSLLKCVLQTQPKAVSSEAVNSDKTVHSVSKSISNSLAEQMDLRAAHADLLETDANGVLPSLSTFLFQEVEKFNILLEVMRNSLKELRNAIKGKSEMTDEIHEIYHSILTSNIPDHWHKVAYLSLKPLGSWIIDLAARVKFIYDWVKYGSQSSYWLSAFFFPQSFLTSVLQCYSRKYLIPIDILVFTFEVSNWTAQEFKKVSSDGVFVYGLYLEGAHWDKSEMILTDAVEKEIYFTMPVIQFLPTKDYVGREGDYQCPVYKTAKRAGVLSSTGLSTNFIVYVDLPSEENPDKWTLLGTALLCQINN